MTLAEYRKTLKGVQWFVFAVPIISGIFERRSGVPFPPLGDDSAAWRFVAVTIIGSSAFLPYFLLPSKGRPWIIAGLFAIFLTFFATYVSFEGTYVLAIPYSNGGIRYVTRGSVRNPNIKEPYSSMSDYDLIEHSGQSDFSLEHAYTKQSLQANKQKLFWSYVLSLVFLELMLGSFARAGIRSWRG